MSAPAYKKTADMGSLCYSPDDPYPRLGPVHMCVSIFEYMRMVTCSELFLHPLQWARAETFELIEGCYSEGDSQGLPG